MQWLNRVVALVWADSYIQQTLQLDLQEFWALPAEMYPTALCLRVGGGYSPLIHGDTGTQVRARTITFDVD